MLPPMPKPMGTLPPSVSSHQMAAVPPAGPPPPSAINRAMLDSASKMLEEVKRRQAELDEAQAMMRAAQDLQAPAKKRPRQPSGPPPKHKVMRGSAGVQVTLKAKAAPLPPPPPGASSSASSSWQQQDRIDEPTYIRSVV
jgi:hypothetical protein